METFKSLNALFPGRIQIVGSGPSLDRFQFDQTTPRILINHAIFVAPIVPGKTFGIFLDDQRQHDKEWFEKIPPGIILTLPKVLMGYKGGSTPPVDNRTILFNREACKRWLQVSRDELADRETLYEWCGTVTTAVHLAWYMGATEIQLIGIDGTKKGRAASIEKIYRMKQEESPEYDRIKLEAIETAAKLKLPIFDFSLVKV